MIVEEPGGHLRQFDWLGAIVIAATLLSLVLMSFIHKQVPERPAHGRFGTTSTAI